MNPGDAAAGGSGLDRLTAGLWLAIAAAVLQLTAVASDWYQYGDTVRDAWFGVPHTAQLTLLSGVVTLGLVALVAGDRSPMRGRGLGLAIAAVGLIAGAQLLYRIAVPPFGGCLTFNCAFTPRRDDIEILLGAWIALGGNAGAVLGGLWHAASPGADRIKSNFWVAERQAGMSPWLGIGAAAAAGMFLAGHTWLDFYAVPQEDGGFQNWSAWIAIPHSAAIVLVAALGIVGLAVAAARNRNPLDPRTTGAVVGILGLLATSRIVYRVIVTPFYSGPAANAGFQQGTQIQAPAYVALALGVVTIVAGLVHMSQQGGAESAAVGAGRPATGEAS